MAKYKCPECDSLMESTDEGIVECTSCDHTIASLEEAEAMFEKGNLMMQKKAKEDKDKDKDSEDNADENMKDMEEALDASKLGLSESATLSAFKAMTTNLDAYTAIQEGKSVEDVYKEFISEDIDGINFTKLSEDIQIVEEKSTVDLSALFESAELDTETKEKATLVFEAAVKEQVSARLAVLEDLSEKYVTEAIEEKALALETKVDEYLTYVAEQFVADNKIAIETGLKVEAAEKVLAGVAELMEDNALTVDEDKVEYVEQLEGKLEEAEASADKALSEAVAMKSEVAKLQRSIVLKEQAQGLTDTQAEKLGTLTEDIDFDDSESFSSKVETIKESFFKSDDKQLDDGATKALDEDVKPVANNGRSDLLKSVVSILAQSE